MIAIAPILWLIARTMKKRVSFNPETNWDFHSQEIQYDEYAIMMADYRSGYTHMISIRDLRFLIAAIVLLVTAMMLPLVLVAISVSLVIAFPFVFGGLEIGYGLVLTSYFYRSIANEASAHFLFENPSRLKDACKLLEGTPGFTMVGVGFQIGEAGGYYAFRAPAAVGRIAGIEAVAKVEITVADIIPPMTAFGTVSSSTEGEASKRMMELQPGNESSQLEEIVRWCITTYVEENGSNEILDELMEELGFDFTPSDDFPPSID
jgi:hypothetical protein